MGTYKGKSENKGGEDARRLRGLACKRRGEMVEAEFLAKVARLEFRVAKPWGETDRYDFVVDAGSGFWRVQVKHTTCRQGEKYLLALARRGEPYNAEEIDFLVAYVMPEDLWYVLPVEMVATRRAVELCPRLRRSKFDRYREAWCLLTCSRKARGWKDVPVLCRSSELEARCAVCPKGEGGN